MNRSLLRLPLWLALPYLLLTWLLFLVGPYDWPVREWWVIYGYVPAVFGLLALGFLVGSNGAPRSSGMPSAKILFYVGSIGALLLWAPTTLTYTGKLPWQVAGSLADQKQAYSALAEQLAATAGNRGPLAALRALVGPFTFCVLPISILLWSTMTRIEKVLAIVTVLIGVDLSVLRGTTAQLADIFIVGIAAFMVKLALSGRGVTALAKHWRGIVVALLALALVGTALIGRNQARLGGANIGCLANSGVCADLSSGVYGHLSDTMASGSAAVAGYFSQGYYGLALAAEKDFEPTWGIGHSPVASALFVMVGGDERFANRTYTFRARDDGWSDETQWSSLMTWLANDVTLWGALVLIYALGWLWGRVWVDAAVGGDIRAAILFCVLTMMVIYLPANNYVMASYEGYATLLFWLVAWAIRRAKGPPPLTRQADR